VAILSAARVIAKEAALFDDYVSLGRKVMTESNPWIGTWKLNLAKSTYRTGLSPANRTTTYEMVQGRMRKASVIVSAEGTETRVVTGPYAFDGKPCPVTGAKDYDASSYKRINDLTYEATRTKAGKVVQTVTNVISADGKTRTVTTTGTDLNGREVNFVNVYEKQ
jgi:hypothetical protein